MCMSTLQVWTTNLILLMVKKKKKSTRGRNFNYGFLDFEEVNKKVLWSRITLKSTTKFERWGSFCRDEIWHFRCNIYCSIVPLLGRKNAEKQVLVAAVASTKINLFILKLTRIDTVELVSDVSWVCNNYEYSFLLKKRIERIKISSVSFFVFTSYSLI